MKLIHIGSLHGHLLVHFCFVSSRVPIRVKETLSILHLPGHLSIHRRGSECSIGPSKNVIAVTFRAGTDVAVWRTEVKGKPEFEG